MLNVLASLCVPSPHRLTIFKMATEFSVDSDVEEDRASQEEEDGDSETAGTTRGRKKRKTAAPSISGKIRGKQSSSKAGFRADLVG